MKKWLEIQQWLFLVQLPQKLALIGCNVAVGWLWEVKGSISAVSQPRRKCYLNNEAFSEKLGLRLQSRVVNNWRGVWNKALSDFWCNAKFSSSVTTEYKEIWKENLVIYRKSLRAFLQAPLQFVMVVNPCAFLKGKSLEHLDLETKANLKLYLNEGHSLVNRMILVVL